MKKNEPKVIGISEKFSNMSDRLNQFLHIVNDTDFTPEIDLEVVVAVFRKDKTQGVTKFCEKYFVKNYIEKGYTSSNGAKMFSGMRSYLLKLDREGILRTDKPI